MRIENRIVFALIAMAIASAAAGTGANVGSGKGARPQQDAASSAADIADSQQRQGDALDLITSQLCGIEGKVLEIQKTQKTLQSLTLKLISTLPTTDGDRSEGAAGENIIIHFDQSLSRFDGLELAKGSVVKLYFGQIRRSAHWGSDASWMAVKRDGLFYDANGKPVSDDDLYPHADGFSDGDDEPLHQIISDPSHAARKGGYDLDDISSRIYPIKAKVVYIRASASRLYSLRLELIKPLESAGGIPPYKRRGQKVVIDFDERLEHFKKLQLAQGSTVIICFGSVDFVSRWGSNSRWIGVEKDGALYDATGEKTTEAAVVGAPCSPLNSELTKHEP
jgi:hypothetical protein